MPATVSLKKVVDEIELLLDDTWTAYLNRHTGELYTVTVEQADAVDDPDDSSLEDWQREDLPKVREILESGDWLALPTKFDLHEYQIMKAFSLAHADEDQREQLLEAISGRGAFRFFKNLVHRWGIQQQWYDYRNREIERIVADWLDAQEIAYEK
jgi:hypothetical protein